MTQDRLWQYRAMASVVAAILSACLVEAAEAQSLRRLCILPELPRDSGFVAAWDGGSQLMTYSGPEVIRITIGTQNTTAETVWKSEWDILALDFDFASEQATLIYGYQESNAAAIVDVGRGTWTRVDEVSRVGSQVRLLRSGVWRVDSDHLLFASYRTTGLTVELCRYGLSDRKLERLAVGQGLKVIAFRREAGVAIYEVEGDDRAWQVDVLGRQVSSVVYEGYRGFAVVDARRVIGFAKQLPQGAGGRADFLLDGKVVGTHTETDILSPIGLDSAGDRLLVWARDPYFGLYDLAVYEVSFR